MASLTASCTAMVAQVQLGEQERLPVTRQAFHRLLLGVSFKHILLQLVMEQWAALPAHSILVQVSQIDQF
jgi:hypothetical protein